MQNRVTFPDFSAFQIDIPHGSWPNESFWPGTAHSNPDLYSAFWLDFHGRSEPDFSPPGAGAGAPAEPANHED
ncbi:hypothetical protein [Paenarthrobacter aromaticivorans]|jgi:hypothetical protein|uniref:Uncharacterized protein n=1 Tax=Paenarthrobacter aromaticivorans TaxID=2849150 RepID=A0ABS6I1W0_9MICC|nr:hypothetical protein [Paenarthrobacter sp. MMS21-TAE1-1]MBU8865360.1 hypothetical protein [Paenarthrobacter sp. MMS21-TAE1-1]